MDPPPLKLVMVQGPRKGQTLEFGAGSTVRVGRIVRGNNVTIKDAGISSKHVFIGSEAGQWIIRDLDSSNGTFLNSSKLNPQISHPINHDDTIDLGEFTSILVKIDDLDSGNPPTISRQEGNTRSSNVEELIEDKSHNTAQILDNPRRGRSRKGGALKNEIKRLGIPEAAGAVEEEKKLKAESQQMNARVTRSQKNLSVDFTAMEIEVDKIRRGARRRRPPRCEPPKIIQVDGVDDKEIVKEANIDSEEDKKEKFRDQEPPPPESFGVDDIKENVKGLTVQDENCKEDINQSENSVPESSNKEEMLDLEKMTLGQWFNYMEVHLQKQIIEETEVLIEGMRQKAERVHAYMMQQKKSKTKEKEKVKGKDVVRQC